MDDVTSTGWDTSTLQKGKISPKSLFLINKNNQDNEKFPVTYSLLSGLKIN